MAKMKNPPPLNSTETFAASNTGESSSSKKKQKRKRDESPGVAEDALSASGAIDDSIDDARKHTPSKTKKKRKRRRKGPLTVADGAASSSNREDPAGSSRSSPHAVENLGREHEVNCDNITSDVTKGKGKAKKGKEPLTEDHEEASERNEKIQSMESQQSLSTKQNYAGPSSTTIEDLTVEDLAAQKQVFPPSSDQEAFMSSLAQSLVCQICLDPMFRPHTLAPCGHSACFTCLESWFRAPSAEQGAGGNRDRDPENPELLALNSATLLRKRKTCPHCRAHVLSRPMEAWNIKGIIASLYSNNLGEGLFPGARTPPSDTEAAHSGPHPWRGIFRSELNAMERERALMADRNGNGDGPADDLGMRDDEDGVYRCSDCLHEIWQGTCTNCHRFYPAHMGYDFDDDFILDDDDDDLDDLEDMDPDEILRQYEEDGEIGLRQLYHLGLGYGDEDDDGYESSFIDDDGNNDNARSAIDLSANLGRNARNGRRHRAVSIVSLSSGSAGTGGSECETGFEESGDNDEGTGEEEEDNVVPGPVRGRRRRTFVISDDEDTENGCEDDDEDEMPRRRRTRPRNNAISALYEDADHSSSEKEDEDIVLDGDGEDGIRYSDEDEY